MLLENERKKDFLCLFFIMVEFEVIPESALRSKTIEFILGKKKFSMFAKVSYDNCLDFFQNEFFFV